MWLVIVHERIAHTNSALSLSDCISKSAYFLLFQGFFSHQVLNFSAYPSLTLGHTTICMNSLIRLGTLHIVRFSKKSALASITLSKNAELFHSQLYNVDNNCLLINGRTLFPAACFFPQERLVATHYSSQLVQHTCCPIIFRSYSGPGNRVRQRTQTGNGTYRDFRGYNFAVVPSAHPFRFP